MSPKRSRPGRDDARLLEEFLAEGETLLEQGGEALDEIATAERDGSDEAPQEALNALFRAVHSLKGLAGTLRLDGTAALAHELEGLLERCRLGVAPVTAATLDAVRAGLGALEEALTRLGETGADAPPPPELLRLLRAETPGPAVPETSRAIDPEALGLAPELARLLTEYERHRLAESWRKGRPVALLSLRFELDAFEAGLRAAMASAAAAGELIGTLPGESGPDPTAMAFRLLVAAWKKAPAELAQETNAIAFELLGAKPPAADDAGAARAEPASPRRGGETVRVGLEKIGQLVDLAGRLSLARGALGRSLERALASSTDRAAGHEARRAFAEIDRAVGALGRAVLATRLVPVERLATRLARAVSTLGRTLGKDVAFASFGVETEIDKALSDELADPLLHLVRNAMDHGIETAAERAASGKPPRGRIELLAATRGRDVLLTIRDDGRGIDPAAIVARARARGLLVPEEPDPAEPLGLLFKPGFSTADRVSSVSGRGVGLDVVRATLAARKGRVTVRSTVGQGTEFEILVPTTLVLVESLLVKAGGLAFAFPTSGLLHVFRAEPEAVAAREGRFFANDADGEFPLVSLGGALGLPADDVRRGGVVLVAEDASRRAGFLVSSIDGMEDVIVKPLADAIPRVPEVTGATELPGGGLALALDPLRLVERAHEAGPALAGAA